jgi:predicted nucleic acid-binding protein
MIAVADASPLNYLVLAGAVDVLAPLCARVLVPRTVGEELLQAGTPLAVRTWITRSPAWIEILPDPPLDPTLATLDAGERAAIALALLLHAAVLLIDDWDGRAEAVRRHLRVTGTLGVLASAHRHRLLNFENALEQLRQTNMYLSPELIDLVRRSLPSQEKKQ